MKLKWYGHAAFRITASDGTSIITDPYTPETSGFAPITETPDLVVMSSGYDTYHCRADLIPGQFEVVDTLDFAQERGQRMVKGITIKAIETMEALDHIEHAPDRCGMYRFEVDGISIGHIGDAGNPFTDEEIAFFKDLDIFLALAGGHPTIRLPDLKDAIDKIKPRLVVPMHFRTLTYKPRNMFWIENFLSLFDDEQVDFACHYEAEITEQSLPPRGQTRVLVLDYFRR